MLTAAKQLGLVFLVSVVLALALRVAPTSNRRAIGLGAWHVTSAATTVAPWPLPRVSAATP
jgi:hypothetical protein